MAHKKEEGTYHHNEKCLNSSAPRKVCLSSQFLNIQESIRVRGFLTDPKLHTGSLLLNASWHSRNSQITKTVCKQLCLWRIEHKVIDATEESFSKVPTGGSECHLSETHLFSFHKFYWSIVDSQCCVHFETHFEIHNALTLSFGARSEKKLRVIFRDLNADDAEEGACGRFYLPLVHRHMDPHRTCLTWRPGTILFLLIHFIYKEHHTSLSFFWCCQKVLRLQIYCLELEESHTNLFSLIPGPRQGRYFSSQTCLFVPWSSKVMYSNCSYRRTGLESTEQWELGSHGDVMREAQEYPTQSWRKFWAFSILFPINRYICLWFKTLIEHYLESQLTDQLVHYRGVAKVVTDLQRSYLVDAYGNTETFPGVTLSTWSLNLAPGPVTERWKIECQVWRCSKSTW